ncbi:dynein-related AAA-type ATPase, putative, partial [Hepatocystis sp. ex Piliocolobus tephrosceles]
MGSEIQYVNDNGGNKDVDFCDSNTHSNPNELIFKFHDGILIDCLKNGHWILLDEINLAQTEILQRLQGLLDTSNEYFEVIEKGNEKIKIHKNFRLFACMNPPIIPSLKKEAIVNVNTNDDDDRLTGDIMNVNYAKNGTNDGYYVHMSGEKKKGSDDLTVDQKLCDKTESYNIDFYNST